MQGEWEQSSIYLQLFKSYISLKTCRRLEELKDNKKRHKNNKNNEKITGFHNSFPLISSLAPGYFPFLISLFFLVFTSEMYTTTSVLTCHKSLCCCQPLVPAPNMNFHSLLITASFFLSPVYSSSSQLLGEKSLSVFCFVFPCTF